MAKKLGSVAVHTVLPSLLGAAGALAATMAPAYYSAICGGSMLPGL